MLAGIITSTSAVSLTLFSYCRTSADERVLLSGYSFTSNSSVCHPGFVKGCCTGFTGQELRVIGLQTKNKPYSGSQLKNFQQVI